jgi:hypothetical protein
MGQRRGSPERLSQLQEAILTVVADGEWRGEGGAYGRGEIRAIVRTMDVTQHLKQSYLRSLHNLDTKGLIDKIPYTVHGQASGWLVGLSAKGRALVRARGLFPPHLLRENHPARIDVPRPSAP